MMRKTLTVLIAAGMLGGPAGLSAADRILELDAIATGMYFSADGKSLKASSRSGKISTWDLTSGKKVDDAGSKPGLLLSAGMYAEADFKTEKMAIWDLSAERRSQIFNGLKLGQSAVSRDGKQLAVSYEDARSVEIWNTATRQRSRVLPDGIGGASQLVFAPDGRTLVSATYDNDIRSWDTKSGELLAKVDDQTGAMFAAEFMPDGKQLVVAGLDETVYFRDAKTLAVQRKLTGHGEVISALAISPDGKTLVTGGFDTATVQNPVKIVIWDVASGKITRVVPAAHQAVSLAFSPDGKWLALRLESKEIRLLDLAELGR